MPGEAQHIHTQCLYVDGLGSGRLRGIHDQQQAVPVRKGRSLCKIGTVAGHIGRSGHDQRSGVWAHKLFPFFILQAAFGVYPGKAELAPLCPQPVQRPQDRIMLTHGGDDMIPRPQQPAQGGVQRP